MWPNPQETTDLVTFTEEILNGNLHFSRSALTILTESCIIDVWRSLKPSRHSSWWRRVEDVFSVTLFFQDDCTTSLESILQTRLKDILKTSWRRLGRSKIVTMKKCLQRKSPVSVSAHKILFNFSKTFTKFLFNI